MSVYDLPDFDAQPLCAEIGGDMFFPDAGEPTRPAKDVCAKCELQAPCLEYALEWKVAGIWGGTSEQQRRRIRKRRGIVAKNITVAIAADRRETALRMHARGTSVVDIARTLGVTQEAVHRIMRGAA